MRNKTRLDTILFVFGLLLAGFANAMARQLIKLYGADPGAPALLPFGSTILFCLNLALYLFLLLFWIRSVQQRLLPSRTRSYLIAAACCAFVMLMLRRKTEDAGGEMQVLIDPQVTVRLQFPS